jgi:hypothetical protein
MKKMVKRKDGSYSQWGLWDSIRANKGSGKKPTPEMLEQERKIKKGQMGMEVPYYLDYQPQFMQVGGLFPRFMQDGGEPDGQMALGQLMSMADKLSKLKGFIEPDSDLEPWVNSKITLADDYIDAISDYMTYGSEYDEMEEGEEEEEEDEYSENEMEEMRNGGIPERYRKRGFTRVGAKRKSTRPGKKWMVLAKKGDQYKIVHGGYKGMQDYTQHRNRKRQKNFWNRMGGRNSGKATDPFSPLYWHKRFGTWQDGGELFNTQNTNTMNSLYDFIQRAQMGGQQDPQQDQIMQLIQMYAELQGIDPNAIIQQLQELPTNEQQQAIEQMMQEVQTAMQQQGGAQQGMMQQQQPMMRRGGNMPCFECGGQYQYGGMMDDQYGGLVMPAMPMLDAYGLPLYAEGGSKNWIQKAVKRPGRCTPGSPNYDCPKGSPQWNLAQRFKSGEFRKKKMYGGLAEMESGGKPSWLIEAQLKAQGYTGSALSNKMGQLGKASYGGDADLYQMGSGGYSGTFSGNAYYQDGGVSVGDVVDATPEMLAWLDANGYTYEKA